MSFGYIYLKKDLNADGSVRAYCFGKTSRTQKRDQAYRKENPFIKNMASYSASDMHAAEAELIAAVQSGGMALVANSDEWIRPECINRFKPIWHRVAEKYKAKTPQTKSKVDIEREAERQREQALAEKAKQLEAIRQKAEAAAEKQRKQREHREWQTRMAENAAKIEADRAERKRRAEMPHDWTPEIIGWGFVLGFIPFWCIVLQFLVLVRKALEG